MLNARQSIAKYSMRIVLLKDKAETRMCISMSLVSNSNSLPFRHWRARHCRSNVIVRHLLASQQPIKSIRRTAAQCVAAIRYKFSSTRLKHSY